MRRLLALGAIGTVWAALSLQAHEAPADTGDFDQKTALQISQDAIGRPLGDYTLLDRNGELISVDSRPSDALALALRLDCPIYVEETVLKSSKLAATVSDKVNNEELRRWLEGLNDEDLGRYKM